MEPLERLGFEVTAWSVYVSEKEPAVWFELLVLSTNAEISASLFVSNCIQNGDDSQYQFNFQIRWEICWGYCWSFG
jgi:hypothetical protein